MDNFVLNLCGARYFNYVDENPCAQYFGKMLNLLCVEIVELRWIWSPKRDFWVLSLCDEILNIYYTTLSIDYNGIECNG